VASAQEELRALVGGVAEALGLLGRTVHELEERVAQLEVRPAIPPEQGVPVRPAPEAPRVVGASVSAPPVAAYARTIDENAVDVPWRGGTRRRMVAVVLAVFLLLGAGGLIAALAGSYASS
jgi:hypothetical protein